MKKLNKQKIILIICSKIYKIPYYINLMNFNKMI